jgi:hypothetical protein
MEMMSNRTLITRIFYLFALVAMGKMYLHQMFPHQLQSPVLVNPMADNTYWMFYILNIPQFLLANHMAAIIFECALVLSAVFSFINPKNVFFSRIFFILFSCFFITSNTFHGHGWIALLVTAALFCIKKDSSFVMGFYALRYYVIFVIFSASIWKLARGGVLIEGQMSEILKMQHLYQLAESPSSLYSHFIWLLIDSPFISQCIFVIACGTQFAFAIGFFTTKYDKALLCLFFLFFLGDWIFMGISFFEFYIFCLPLIRWPEIQHKYNLLT